MMRRSRTAGSLAIRIAVAAALASAAFVPVTATVMLQPAARPVQAVATPAKPVDVAMTESETESMRGVVMLICSLVFTAMLLRGRNDTQDDEQDK